MIAQQAYLKASNAERSDEFGSSVGISGSTVVVGADYEDSIASGVNGDQDDNSVLGAGAAYIFGRDSSGIWSQEAYIKASSAPYQFSLSEKYPGIFQMSLHLDGSPPDHDRYFLRLECQER